MRTSRLVAALAFGLLLGGCQTITPEQQRAADEARCKSFGFHRGADAFSKCLLDLDLDRAADRRARYQQMMMYPGPRFYGGPYWRYW